MQPIDDVSPDLLGNYGKPRPRNRIAEIKQLLLQSRKLPDDGAHADEVCIGNGRDRSEPFSELIVRLMHTTHRKL